MRYLAAALLLAPLHANAALISTSIGEYDVTYAPEGSTLSLMQSQPWWEDSGIAREFALLLLDDFDGQLSFATHYFDSCSCTPDRPVLFGSYWEREGGFFMGFDIDPPASFGAPFAVATQVPEPATLLLLGAGLIGMVATRRASSRSAP